METFGDRLRRLRGDQSQKDIATGLGMPTTTLASLETQETVPRGEVLSKLANYFKVPIDYFYRTPSPDLRPSDAARDAARAWFRKLQEPTVGKDTIATLASDILDDSIKEQIADRIRKKRSAEVSGDE